MKREELKTKIAEIIAGVPADRITHFARTCDWSKADEILSIPELEEWAMERFDLVKNGTVNLSTLPIKKRANLIIGDSLQEKRPPLVYKIPEEEIE